MVPLQMLLPSGEISVEVFDENTTLANVLIGTAVLDIGAVVCVHLNRASLARS